MAAVGDELTLWRLEAVSAEAMKVLATILRDPNPIHLDTAAVAALGLGDRQINQGPANLAYVINMLNAALPDARLLSLDMRFVANVFAGEAVEAGGRMTAMGNGPSVTCDVWLRADGRVALSGTAVLALPPEQQGR